MQRRIEQRLIFTLAGLVVLVTAFLLAVPDAHRVSLATDVSGVATYSVKDLIRPREDIFTQEGMVAEEDKHQLRLTLPRGVDADSITCTRDIYSKKIVLSIPGVSSSYFYDYPMVGSSDGIREFTFAYAGETGFLDITTTRMRELSMTVDGDYVYLDFLDPHELYDAIVVIDAGHGGKDAGAVAGEHYEKDINLAISEALRKECEDSDYNVGFYFTRTDDTFVELEDRVGLSNTLEADLFLSIHNNSTASGRLSSINGAEVMYCVSDESGASKAFSEICLNELLEALGCTSKGLVAGDDIYIIRTSEAPVALAEIGFITNETELNNLLSEDYQKKAAHALYRAIIKTLKKNDKIAAERS